MENNETEIEEGVAQSEMDIGSESDPLNVISFEEIMEFICFGLLLAVIRIKNEIIFNLGIWM